MDNTPKSMTAACLGTFILLALTLQTTTFHQVMGNANLRNDSSTAQSHKQGPTNIRGCVPHYKVLRCYRNSRIGYRKRGAKELSLIASYDYGSYSVVTVQADGLYGRIMHCRYLDENRREIYPSVASFVFPEFAVHCCSRPNVYFMSVTESPSSSITEYVHVNDRRKDEPKYFLSLCLAPLYGNRRKWLFLAELVEHYKMHGVDHFYIYVKDMDDYTFKLIEHYEKSGIAEVIFFRIYSDRVGTEWQLVGIE
ncbi:hypothetical protein Y032_0588g349, partial [Ancylostoma ceylanicum]